MACASIHLLSADEIDEAYVLARLSDAGLTLKAWCRRAAARCASPAVGGVLLARDLDARPCGLLVYALAAQPVAGEACRSNLWSASICSILARSRRP